MGVTVRQKEKGKGKPWWVFINHNGHRQAKKVGDKAAAEAVAREIRERLAREDFRIGSKPAPSFGEYARKWLNGYARTTLKYSTLKGYDSLLSAHLTPLMDRPLDQISRPEIREIIYEKLNAGLAPKTVNNIKALISSIFSQAFEEDELISAHPATRLGKYIKSKGRKADVTPLTREEAQVFLKAMADHYPRYYPFFLCALRTGMRLGEIRALQWGNIDFQGNFIEVCRAYTKGQFTTPKSGKTRRVDMSQQLSLTLKALQTEQKRQALAKGWGEVPELVFVNELGKIIDDGNLRRRVFNPALAKAGLRRIRIHDLRHTFASLLIQQGESLAYVRDQLGHHSIQITVDIYGHLVPGANRKAVNRLDDEEEVTILTKVR